MLSRLIDGCSTSRLVYASLGLTAVFRADLRVAWFKDFGVGLGVFKVGFGFVRVWGLFRVDSAFV